MLLSSSVFWLVVGVVVGWHVPQPVWAKAIQDKVMSWFKKGE